MKVVNPHDKFFKKVMSQPENAKAFLNTFLSADELQHLDMNSIEYVKESFLSKQLEESFSDLILKCKIKDDEAYIS